VQRQCCSLWSGRSRVRSFGILAYILYFSIFENLCMHTQNFDIVEFNYKITPSNHMLIWKKLLRKSTIGLRLFRHERNRNEVIRHIMFQFCLVFIWKDCIFIYIMSRFIFVWQKKIKNVIFFYFWKFMYAYLTWHLRQAVA